jgi:hypothetical protein
MPHNSPEYIKHRNAADFDLEIQAPRNHLTLHLVYEAYLKILTFLTKKSKEEIYTQSVPKHLKYKLWKNRQGLVHSEELITQVKAKGNSQPILLLRDEIHWFASVLLRADSLTYFLIHIK